MIQKLQTDDGSRNKAELGWIFLIDIVAAKFCTWKGIFPERHHPAIYGSSIRHKLELLTLQKPKSTIYRWYSSSH